MNNLFLITQDGERREDHIPCGFYNYEKMVETFGEYIGYYPGRGVVSLTKDVLNSLDNEWHRIFVLDTVGDEDGDLLWQKYIKDPDKYYDDVSDVLLEYNIIRVSPRKIPST